MPERPVVTAARAIKALSRVGFVFERQKGSHVTLWHPERRQSVTVPDHGSKPLKAGTLSNILRQVGLTADEFRKLLR